MPAADGHIPPVTIPRIPWKEDEGEEAAQAESLREFEGEVVQGPWPIEEQPDQAA